MKKVKRIFAVILTAALAVMMLAFNVSAADAANLSETEISLEVGSAYQLYVDRATQSISWTSSNKAVATVTNGKVSAKKAGTTTITAKHGKTSLKCKVTVVKKGELKKETTVKLTKYYKTKDWKNKDVIVLEFDFTNCEKDPKSFMWFTTVKAFQSGVECDKTYSYAVDTVDTSNNDKEIKPGTTIHVTEMFYLSDLSPVDIEVKELIGDRVFLSKTLTIK